ncbi:hypothetical protein NC653_037473 [Populus alba x Populus x berolinensis]|uniref:Uncharacterized protein n=1 Tax=Populus alba x Populus x berolinensis TaxID=444605 RepID=A0AAD6LG36_9ROSI|nr:hypothetical protein NC653_037473 [Populus alba x Populus x berolinensis]
MKHLVPLQVHQLLRCSDQRKTQMEFPK